MKSLFTLALAFFLLTSAFVVHAQSVMSGTCSTGYTWDEFLDTCVPSSGASGSSNTNVPFNVCSATLEAGQDCSSCQNSCDSARGLTCGLSGKCESLNGSATQGPSGNNSVTQGPTGNTNGNNNGSSVTLLNPLNSGTSLPAFLSEILAFIIKLGTVVIVLMVVYVGFKFVMAQGEPGAISEARQALLWTVVGALILLGAQAIASAIQATASAL